MAKRSSFNRWTSWTVVALAVVTAIYFLRPTVDVPELLVQSRRALLQQQPDRAEHLARQILDAQPDHADALMIAAIAAGEQARYIAAIEYCQRVQAEAGQVFVDARCMAGNVALNHLRELTPAEEFYTQALRADPDNLVALDRLSYILSLQTRTWELVPRQLQLIQLQAISPDRLLSLVHDDLLIPDASLLQALRIQEPEHPGLLLGEARAAEVIQDFSRARTLTGAALQIDPEFIEAQARLGQILRQAGSVTELQQWQQQLPPAALDHPETWIALGELANRQGHHTGAARCFWEAGTREAASLTANYLLGQQLAVLGRHDEAQTFLQRASDLEAYRKLFDAGSVAGASVRFSPAMLETAAGSAESLGLLWEAYGFTMLASQAQPAPHWTQDLRSRLRPLLPGLLLTRTAPHFNPFRKIDLSQYDTPEVQATTEHATSVADDVSTSGQANFVEMAYQLGVNFQFDNGADHRISGAQRPYDFTGGGIAAVDMDGDSWPDLYFTQACVIDIAGNAMRGQPDQLYRNRRGQAFVNVSGSSLPADLDYSQGISAGDINNDGFPDLFIGNLGFNRLLLNNGDGTFSDVSHCIDADSAAWTTSCLICDLNADQWPDLYAVNYLSGDILSRVCRDSTGRKNSCAPQTFPAADDQIFLNDGSGQFMDVTDSSGVRIPNGKGLGIVAADLNADRRLDLFVANDGVPNFLFQNTESAGPLKFTEVAMQRGVAVNKEGLSQACMGIVVEDLNLDRRPDLFVTNFLDETNSLYVGSDVNGFFQDEIRGSGMAQPGLPVLGFGSQALDGDLDGRPDLIVVNGHVDDFTDRNVPYRMSPHYFQNHGGFQFELQNAAATGEYFSGKYLGRSVARLDWDKDGAEDVVAGTLDQATALLHNTTSARGNSITLNLRSAASQRDCLGSLVTVTSPNGTVQRQLTAGDGYQASNERVLVFGLGQNSSAVQIVVNWPGGREQKFPGTNVNMAYTAVEGRDRLYSIPQ